MEYHDVAELLRQGPPAATWRRILAQALAPGATADPALVPGLADAAADEAAGGDAHDAGDDVPVSASEDFQGWDGQVPKREAADLGWDRESLGPPDESPGADALG